MNVKIYASYNMSIKHFCLYFFQLKLQTTEAALVCNGISHCCLLLSLLVFVVLVLLQKHLRRIKHFIANGERQEASERVLPLSTKKSAKTKLKLSRWVVAVFFLIGDRKDFIERGKKKKKYFNSEYIEANLVLRKKFKKRKRDVSGHPQTIGVNSIPRVDCFPLFLYSFNDR